MANSSGGKAEAGKCTAVKAKALETRDWKKGDAGFISIMQNAPPGLNTRKASAMI